MVSDLEWGTLFISKGGPCMKQVPVVHVVSVTNLLWHKACYQVIFNDPCHSLKEFKCFNDLGLSLPGAIQTSNFPHTRRTLWQHITPPTPFILWKTSKITVLCLNFLFVISTLISCYPRFQQSILSR